MVSPSVVPLDRAAQGLDARHRGGRARQGQAGPHQRQVGLRALQGQAGRADRVPVAAPRADALRSARPSSATTTPSSRTLVALRHRRRAIATSSAFRARRRFQRDLMEFLTPEKALAAVEVSERDGRHRARGGRRVAREGREPGRARAGDGGRALQPRAAPRADRSRTVELELDVKAALPRRRPGRLQHDRRDPGHGQGRRGRDGWARTSTRGTRAPAPPTTRRASAVAMEAVRILKALEREAAPHHPRRALERRGAGPAAARAPTSSSTSRVAPDAEEARESKEPRASRRGPLTREARAREALRLLQPRQRHRKDPRDLRPGERGRGADLRGLAGAARATSAPHRHHPQHRRHRPRALRRGRPARLPVHPGPGRLPDAHATTRTWTSTTACRRRT